MERTEESKAQSGEEQHRCLSCGITSAARPLIQLESQGKENWVCVRCLPMLIHGGQ